ncbi:hypothetical protein [Parasphingorhabdus sp.]|uniref:hypothetical protein n=1 Tax=Parasphingorhabdus sp. TaxID=2709688 RepID=UPI0032638A2E
MRITYSLLTIPFILLAFNACSAAPLNPAPLPEPTPVPVQAKPVTPLPPAPVQPQGDWSDWPITVGAWVYREDARGSLALFGQPDEDAVFIIRCNQSGRQLFLSRAGSVRNGAAMLLRASAGLQSYTARNSGGTPHYAAVSISIDDIMLDRIAYSRGRFAIETDGLQSIAIPIAPEFSRVVEDCRG